MLHVMSLLDQRVPCTTAAHSDILKSPSFEGYATSGRISAKPVIQCSKIKPTLRHQTSWEHIQDHYSRATKLKKLSTTHEFVSPVLPVIHEQHGSPPSYESVLGELTKGPLPKYSFFNVKSTFKLIQFTDGKEELPRYIEGRDSILGSFHFENPDTSTCCLKVQGGHSFWIHSHYLSPISGYFRDLLNPRYQPQALFIKLNICGKSYYRIIDTPVTTDMARFRFETQKLIASVCKELLGTSFARQCKTLNSINDKQQLFEHLRQYKTHLLIKNLENKGFYASGSFKPMMESVPQPILSIHVPHPYLFGILLKWMYTRSDEDLFREIDLIAQNHQDQIPTCRHVFHLIELANYLRLAPCFYTTLASYFCDRGELTLSRRFHHSIVPLSLMNTFLSITGRWEENDRLAVILWWARSANDDLRLKVRRATCNLDDDESFKIEVKRLDTQCQCFNANSESCILIQKTVMDGLLSYIQFNVIDERYCAELLDLLPETFTRAIRP